MRNKVRRNRPVGYSRAIKSLSVLQCYTVWEGEGERGRTKEGRGRGREIRRGKEGKRGEGREEGEKGRKERLKGRRKEREKRNIIKAMLTYWGEI